MATISGTVYSSLSALNTYSVAIDVTSTNIANAESAGYARQTAVIGEKIAADGTGYGVDVSAIKRSTDSFLAAQLRTANQELGKSGVEAEVLSSLEQVFSETDGSGLSAAMNEFWNAWQEVVNDPSGSVARSVLASSADTLADNFNAMSAQLSEISAGIEDGIEEAVTQINDLVRQIADANQDLLALDTSRQNANPLRDKLDTLVQELSSLIDVKVSTNEIGQVSIQLANNDDLVEADGMTTHTLATAADATTGLLNVNWEDGAGNVTEITGDISSGKLGGYLEVRESVAGYGEQLGDLAGEIIAQVNGLHESGYDLYGNQDAVPLFTGSGAADMKVNPDIAGDPGKIAAATGGGTGDGSNARAIAELQNSLQMTGGTATFSDYYASLVSGIGDSVQAAQTGYESQSNIQAYYTNACLSVSGVSTDEEMAKLILYQHAYEAAAKIMTALDELMQTLIRM